MVSPGEEEVMYNHQPPPNFVDGILADFSNDEEWILDHNINDGPTDTTMNKNKNKKSSKKSLQQKYLWRNSVRLANMRLQTQKLFNMLTEAIKKYVI